MIVRGVLVNDNTKNKENINIGTITVIDSIMGSGKTSWAIQEINANKETSYIFVTPFLSEIDRIRRETDIVFYEPIQKGEGKLKSFHELLINGHNVAVTHKLFTMITNETRELILQGGYILIIDEALDVIDVYGDIKEKDVELLKDEGIISVDKNNHIIWERGKKYEGGSFDDIEILSNNKSLITYSDKIFLWQFPPDVFSLCEHTYIMTYNFDGTIMSAYFNIHNLIYEKKQVIKTNTEYILTEHTGKIDCKYNLSELITICEDKKLNNIGNKRTALSVNWFKVNKDNENMQILKNNITNYLQNKISCNSSSVMWTTFSDYEKLIEYRGRKFTRQLTGDERRRYQKKKAQGSKIEDELLQLKCFISCSTRATNMYCNRSVLVYALNYYPNTVILQHIRNKNINFDIDQYALNGVIQWIWRSRIRNGEPISIYIPSSRMRSLFKGWLKGLGRTPS